MKWGGLGGVARTTPSKMFIGGMSHFLFLIVECEIVVSVVGFTVGKKSLIMQLFRIHLLIA
jgi:hypothetical protein